MLVITHSVLDSSPGSGQKTCIIEIGRITLFMLSCASGHFLSCRIVVPPDYESKSSKDYNICGWYPLEHYKISCVESQYSTRSLS